MRHPARTDVGEHAREDRSTLREPLGEPRVSRVRQRPSALDLDVPEFIPRR
jgi:hypothetical protein